MSRLTAERCYPELRVVQGLLEALAFRVEHSASGHFQTGLRVGGYVRVAASIGERRPGGKHAPGRPQLSGKVCDLALVKALDAACIPNRMQQRLLESPDGCNAPPQPFGHP
jgi:hypothetical protein